MKKSFYSNGKIILTAEYAVLDGAQSLTLPAKFGQSLEIESINGTGIEWISKNDKGEIWIYEHFSYDELKKEDSAQQSEKDKRSRIIQILNVANKLNPEFLSGEPGLKIETILNFPANWGLGSSSTLINNIAQCLNVDAYQLLEKTFGGSGFDVAAAQHNFPILFQNNNGPQVLETEFNPPFADHLFFIHLNRKQNSRKSIKHYSNQPKEFLRESIEKISSLTQSILKAETLAEFELYLNVHETLISQLIQSPKIKNTLFPDFTGEIKSLGGWGGDFVLATGNFSEMKYFEEKGYKTIIPFHEMIL